jgi:hypothetical protein
MLSLTAADASARLARGTGPGAVRERLTPLFVGRGKRHAVTGAIQLEAAHCRATVAVEEAAVVAVLVAVDRAVAAE